MKTNIIKGGIALLLSLTLLAGCGGNAHPLLIATCPTKATFSFTTANFTGDTFTQLLGINNMGEIAGYHGSGADPQNPNKGFTISPTGNFTNENFTNSAQTQVIAVNTNGDTAGFYVDQAGNTHGFLNAGGTFATVDAPNTIFNQLLSLNDKGVAAGYSQEANGTQHPYTVLLGNFTMITTPGASAQATGVNNRGDVSGFYVDNAAVTHGFVIPQGKTLITVDFPQGTFTQVLGLNNLGDAVGTYDDAGGKTHGFIFNVTAVSFESIDDPKGVGTTVVNGLNDLGKIVGFSVDQAGNTNGFSAQITACQM